MKRLLLLLSLCIFTLGTVLAQRTVSGVITDDTGEPLIGANVVVKGSTVGTITDFDGSYELEVPEGSEILVFSYTGYETQEIPLGVSNVMDLVLSEGITLQEAVVTALGVSRERKTLGYSVQEIGGESVNEVRETNFVNSLSGKVTGVNIRQSNTMGGSANILIRGTTSLMNNNQALFVVDGVPIDNNNTNEDRVVANSTGSTQNDGWGGYDYGNAAMDINPDDIESISVLKGAAASALYGSRAANGVILITTKRGGEGRKGIGVTVNSGFTISKIDKSTLPKHQTTYGGGYGPFYEDPTGNFFYADIDGDGVEDLIAPTSEDASWGEKFDPGLQVIHWDALDPAAPNYGEKRPWVAPENGMEYFFQTGKKYTNNISLDGGDEDANFRLSYTNVDEEGLLPNSSIKKNVLNFSSQYKFTDRLSVEANVTYNNTKAEGRYGTGYDGGNVMQSFGQWIQTNVDFKRLEEKWLRADGSQLSWNHGYYDDLHPIYFNNPYWVRNRNFEDDKRDRVFGHAGLNYEFNDWLSASARFSVDHYEEAQNERIAVGSVDQSYYSNFNRNYSEFNSDLTLNATKNFGKLSVVGLLGGNVRKTKIASLLGETEGGLIVPLLYSVKNSISPAVVTENFRESGMNSVYGSLSLGYNDMFYLELTDRYDVTSTLPDDNNGYNYYAVSGSWVLSEMPALKNSKTLSFAKLRANYAEVGNDAPVHSVYDIYAQSANFGNEALFSVPNTKNNGELKPERTKSVEVGLEASFFGRRLGFDVAAYKTNSTDQIMPVRVSRASGYVFRFVNGGEIENKGIELSVNAVPIRTTNFTWDLGVNWYTNTNEVISLYEDTENLLIYSAWDVSVNAAPGEPYGTIKGTDFLYTNGKRTVNESGYYLNAVDENGNEIEDAVIGNINPDWNMGISSDFSYKGLTARVLFDFQQGGDIYSVNTKYGQATGVYEETAALNDRGIPMRDPVADGGGYKYENTVYEDGTPNETYVDAFRWGRAFYYNNSPTARYVFDASYIKLREVSVSYRIPASVVEKTPLSNITVSFVGRNLAILSKNTEHFDPEASLSSGNQQGIESGSYPTPRTFGINIKFGL